MLAWYIFLFPTYTHTLFVFFRFLGICIWHFRYFYCLYYFVSRVQVLFSHFFSVNVLIGFMFIIYLYTFMITWISYVYIFVQNFFKSFFIFKVFESFTLSLSHSLSLSLSLFFSHTRFWWCDWGILMTFC